MVNELTEKYLLALRCLLAAHALDSSHPEVHVQLVQFAKLMEDLPADLDAKVKGVLEAEFNSISPQEKDLNEDNNDFIAEHSNSVPHLQAGAKVKFFLSSDSELSIKDIFDSLRVDSISLRDAQSNLRILEEWKATSEDMEKYRTLAREKWPEATAFQTR